MKELLTKVWAIIRGTTGLGQPWGQQQLKAITIPGPGAGKGGSCCQMWRTAAGVDHIMRAETWGRGLKVTSLRRYQENRGRSPCTLSSGASLALNPVVQSPEAALESKRVEIWKAAWKISSSFSLRFFFFFFPNRNRCCYHKKEPQAILMLNRNYYHL